MGARTIGIFQAKTHLMRQSERLTVLSQDTVFDAYGVRRLWS
jgi:hypothetical protein